MTTRPNKLLDKIIATNTARARKDIQSWRSALQQAENVENPKRTLLYNLYSELMLDAHTYSAIQRRKLDLRGSEFLCKGIADGKADMEKTALFKKPWFYKIMDRYVDTLLYSHTLNQIEDLVDGEITNVTLIKRKHVRPEVGLFVFRESDEKGIYYREDEKVYDWLIEMGDDFDLGLLNLCAPHILYKRFAQAAWSEYCEIFGMPVRFGKTNVKDPESLNRMENMMINMGSAAYGVIDKDEEIEFVQTTQGKGEVYEALIDKCNGEISKLINGAIIGEASKNGSRSKEEVGERMGEALTIADRQEFESFVNFTLIPKLIKLGYPLEGMEFEFERVKNIDTLWKITEGVLQHYDVDMDYIIDTFGIPVTAVKQQNNNNAGQNLNFRDFFLP